MKTYGKVKEYNGYSGTILGVDGKEYLLIKKEIIEDELKENDKVSFVAEKYEAPEFEENIARFVKVLKKEDKNL